MEEKNSNGIRRKAVGTILMILTGVVVISMVNSQIKARPGKSGLAEYGKGNYREAVKHYTAGIEACPDKACLYNNRGLAYYELRKYDEAISDLTKAIELRPNDADAYSNRGKAYWRKGGYKDKETLNKATSDFSKVIELRPDDMEAYYNRALNYSNFFNHWHKEIRTDSKLSGFSPENTYKFIEALADFQKVIESDSPWSALAIAGRANLFYRHANWKVAIMEYKKAIERKEEIVKIVGEDGFGGIYAPMGRTYMSLGEMENAFYAYKKFMDLVPDPLSAFHGLGTGVGMGYAVHVARSVKRYKEAAEWYDRKIAISAKPGARDYSGKGFCYYKLKEYDKAIASYNKCLELAAEGGGAGSEYGGSTEGDARRYLGMIYKEKGNIVRAEKEFRKAIQIYSKKKEEKGRGRVRYQERGLCYLELGEYDKAISDFEKILESKKSRSAVKIKANKNLGAACLRMGNKEKARECFQKTLKLVEAEGEAKKYRYEEITRETEKLLKEL